MQIISYICGNQNFYNYDLFMHDFDNLKNSKKGRLGGAVG